MNPESTRRIIRRTNERADTDASFASLHPVLARVYRTRQLGTHELDRSFDRLLQPAALKGIDTAVALLAELLEQRARILIVADFDADGATSCALMVRALRGLGAADVRYVVPNRFEYGYGLTPEIVELAAKQEPDLIVTVDNGISSIEGVATAKAKGMRVLITDHHLPGSALPAADAIVNPNQSQCAFPSKCLAGVGVAFYVMASLRAHLRAIGWFTSRQIPEPNLADLLDLVALGTVADLVPLDHNNRILVAQGLTRINAGRTSEGIRALAAVAGRQCETLIAADLGFSLAPRLNAAGRLEDMSLGIECLLTDDPAIAATIAGRLDELNRERRAIEAEMQQQAMSAIASLRVDGATLARGLCIYDETWHQGVIGLVASRLKDKFHRPVIALARGTGDELKGSARSVPGLHIRDTLDAIATRYPGLLTRFGGHAMAAGLTLPRGHFEKFRDAFDETVSAQLTEAELEGRIVTDGELNESDLTVELAQLLRDGGPWGQGFPEPMFDGVFEVVSRNVVGGKHVKLMLQPDGSKRIEAIAFHAAPDGVAPAWNRIHAVYRLDVNAYRGRRSLQLVLEHIEPLA